MRLVLVGADYEENLGMCMIAAAAEAAGHSTHVVPFQCDDERPGVIAAALALAPDVIGLAAQFQHRGQDFMSLSRDLRRAGFRGHITLGGQFATMAYASILSGNYGVDSVVLYEGEHSIRELLGALAARRPLDGIAGLALPDGRGRARRTVPRALAASLDALPLAHRYRRHARQLGVPFIPVSGGRGCWAACSFCSITSVLRDGREHGVEGCRLRLRSPEDVGLEMAMLAQAVGGAAVFCFHDENFLLPRPQDSAARVGAIKRVLDEQGVTRAAFVGKCRPDTVTPELARELARLGVIRMYVGIENASPRGAAHLHRGTDVATMGAALDAFSDAGIFACYNLLVFEPDCVLEDVALNIAFMRRHPSTPVNFCRAEPYLGTPMYQRLQREGRLRGSFLGSDYRIADDRAELLFRIAASAFRDHNFSSEGVANRYMSLGYSAKLLATFYQEERGHIASFLERSQELTRSITLDTAELLEQALTIAAGADLADHDRIARETALLGLRVAASDRLWHAAMDTLEADMSMFINGGARPDRRGGGRVAKAAQGAAMAGWLALWATGATGCSGSVDPLPRDAGGLDLPKDRYRSSDGPLVVDALPPDSGAKKDMAVYDPLPPDSGARDVSADRSPIDGEPGDAKQAIDGDLADADIRDVAKEGPMIVDPPPAPTDARDARIIEVDPLPPPSDARDGADSKLDAGQGERPFIVDPVVDARWGVNAPVHDESEQALMAREHWADTSTARIKRSLDLPLCLCPEVRLIGRWESGSVRACLSGIDGPYSVRWQAQGRVDGLGGEALWTPSSDEDQLDVAVRTSDGVAVTLLRLRQVRGDRKA
jgi:anaerobic magnesium-protoporphyrin IX monomethyl ester cyclase